MWFTKQHFYKLKPCLTLPVTSFITGTLHSIVISSGPVTIIASFVSLRVSEYEI